MQILIYSMVYLGSLLMVYNIIGFILFAVSIQKREDFGKWRWILHLPIALLIMFLLGYLAVGIFGDPDLIVSGILFGGSIFVFIIYLLLKRITTQIVESEKTKAEFLAYEKANHAKTTFLSTISHEMRTPMNVIIGLDTVALKDPELPEKTRDQLEKIGLSANHLLALINNILEINDIESGRFEITNAPFRLFEALDQLNAIYSSICFEKGLEYVSRLPNETAGWFIGDELLLKQVLMGIMDNAVKYTDAPGSVELSVDLCQVTGNSRVVSFTVKDTGVGIDPEFLPKIFEVFNREDQSATDSRGGSGVSLALSNKIANMMGGRISVSSEKGKGSSFTVTVPLAIADEPVEHVPEPEEETGALLEGRRILIVEDLPENAEIVADLLELEGAESEHAENGRIGVEMFAASPAGYYDAILMDLRMPVMDGLTAAREIRKLSHPDAQSIPIIALTANAFESDIEESLRAGMNAHLAKPADSDTLYSTIREHISKSKIRERSKAE